MKIIMKNGAVLITNLNLVFHTQGSQPAVSFIVRGEDKQLYPMKRMCSDILRIEP